MALAYQACTNTSFWNNPSWWQVIVGVLAVLSSLILAYIAIFGKEKFFKVKFTYEISKIDQKVNNETYQIFRVKIKNIGKRGAKDTLVTVANISDKKGSNYHKRVDFIHMPLEWTHFPLEKKVRNIAIGEDVYVDIGQYDLFDPGLILYTNPRTSSEQLFAIMNDAKLTLRLVESSGFAEELYLRFKIKPSGGSLEISNRKILNQG